MFKPSYFDSIRAAAYTRASAYMSVVTLRALADAGSETPVSGDILAQVKAGRYGIKAAPNTLTTLTNRRGINDTHNPHT